MLIRHASTSDITTLIELIKQLGYEINKEQVAANLHLYERLQGFVFVAEENGIRVDCFWSKFVRSPVVIHAEIPLVAGDGLEGSGCCLFEQSAFVHKYPIITATKTLFLFICWF